MLANMYFYMKKSTEEIKALFASLPVGVQSDLLDELLQEHELNQETVSNQREKNPCPYYSSSNVYKRGKQRKV